MSFPTTKFPGPGYLPVRRLILDDLLTTLYLLWDYEGFNDFGYVFDFLQFLDHLKRSVDLPREKHPSQAVFILGGEFIPGSNPGGAVSVYFQHPAILQFHSEPDRERIWGFVDGQPKFALDLHP